MADDFDIDIYGDDAAPEYDEPTIQGSEATEDTNSTMQDASSHPEPVAAPTEIRREPTDQGTAHGSSNGAGASQDSGTQQIASTGGAADHAQPPKQAPRQQGIKRKQGEDDDRPLDPGATAALMVNDLNWWVAEDDIRGWANQSGCEDELVEITYNEHKVNGKSKGQVYIQFQTAQAATALKHQIDQFYKDQAHVKKPTAIFNPPHVNPFKTLPKDVPAREKRGGDRSSTGNYSNDRGGGNNFNRFNNRGNFNSNNRGGGGYNNRNFSSPVGGNMGGNMGGGAGMGGYGGQQGMSNFGNPMAGGMASGFGGGFNRGGGMMGMRGGGMNNRGGRGGGSGGMGAMGGMPGMGGGMPGMNMPMGAGMMGMAGGMMNMGGAMGNNMGMMGGPGGFGGGQGHFNPAFFGQNQGGSDGNWNPHGAKRPRPE
ncbi:hypothetical protein P154DRAFT_592462 [Amniculicola lignicola CBS 123094]|uniref:RRM domain-containing protein n=1 Tax=Amniculicola lignicola CBS 123094 TaxID=1392246 RepID=A0A6A5WZH0_9PLEO|nr:hypothetical protein P154DRAFT_592462 [Amniculicola lignicola CBS 123094]